jgi:GntR family transcriptional regulator, transcriptional repressor for pyruvate dehydrogenase complex
MMSESGTGLPVLGATPKLPDQVAVILRERVAQGQCAPGARLPSEAQLAEALGVSRTVVREAISRLKSEGLLDSRQGRGVFVETAPVRPLRLDPQTGLSRDTAVQIVELRRAIEIEAAGLAAERRTANDLARMRQALAGLERAVAAGESGVAEDLRFHYVIAEATRNPYYLAVLEFLGQFLHGTMRATRASRRTDFIRQTDDEHAAIVAAIASGDAHAARKASAQHLVNSIKRMAQAGPEFWIRDGAAAVRTIPPTTPKEEL